MTEAERIEKLETTTAYQEQAIDDLNQIVLAQAREIETLNRLVANLTERLHSLAEHPALAEAPEPPPPHY